MGDGSGLAEIGSDLVGQSNVMCSWVDLDVFLSEEQHPENNF